MERLQKVIAAAGIASRRKAEILISEGRVKVNGEVISELGFKVKKSDVIKVDNKLIEQEEKVYFLMNKPKKTLCTNDDEFDRPTVVNLVNVGVRVFSVGRLDYDTSGALVLTNDGEFANMLIHPRYHIPKKYSLTVKPLQKGGNGILKKQDVEKLINGVILDDGVETLPAKVKVVKRDDNKNQTDLELTIFEGRNRQVKRMMEALGYKVTRLHRKELAFLKVDDLSQGSYRKLKPFEVKQLKSLAISGKLLKG